MQQPHPADGARLYHPPITVYDSLQVSFGLGTPVREAAKLAKQNKSAAEIVAQLDVIRPKIGVYFARQSLEYARRGGRVGAIRVLAADFLNVKPILTFKDGLVKDIGIVRGYSNAVSRVVELYRKRAVFGGDVFLFHSEREELARQIRQQLPETDPDCRVRICWVGAVIGVYTGPGCIGLAFMEKDA
ncbi:MAG: DegV family protein [Oscillospiraceae bacterium]